MRGETGKRAEDWQGAAIGYEMPGILYGEMLDISEVGRREKVDGLYGKMADFSDHLLGVDLVRFDSAGVCC